MRATWIIAVFSAALAFTAWQDIFCGFEADKDGGAAAGFSVGETAGTGKPATWIVRSAAGASCGRNFLSISANENTGSTYNMLLLDKAVPADATVSVRLRAASGDEDRGGGLVWRAADTSNYYVTRWNPLEKNLRAYKVVEGKRSSAFGSVNIDADASVWHAMKVRMEGSKATIFFDGAVVLEFSDDNLKAGGKTGLWTKADACTDFDDLEIMSREGP
ncbi:MAG: hypothetical protein EXS14_01785 [Planctomycetes bacterium]|nr:hypothetical protein [Planctomycetota bacterium]